MTETHHKHHSHRRFSNNFYNPVTYAGVVLSALVILSEIILFAFDFFSSHQSIYLGIFTYLILPLFLVIGLLLIPIGAHWKKKRVERGLVDDKPKAIHLDLSKSTHQNAIVLFVCGTFLVLIMTAIGSYKAFHYTESNLFCGTTCHNIMEPEYVAHMKSPHAKLNCVDCHIGSGANWYIHYKMAGVRMLQKTFQGNYSKPIPAPVTSLRPAKEICQECHWTGKSFANKEVTKTYYKDDPSSTLPWNITLLMPLGAKNSDTKGVHSHMSFDEDVYYVPEDDQRQKISWIKTVNKAGDVKIYTTKDSPYKEIAPPAEKIRKMDCIDCHNRPTHRFEAPIDILNNALVSGEIDPTIINIKGKAIEALSKQYATVDEAENKIHSSLTEYYQKKQANFYHDHKQKVDQAIDKIIALYKVNFFPGMKSRWDAYPDNIGHKNTLGCFRCHDDEHKSLKGEVVRKDCTICHTITAQGTGDKIEKNIDGMEFVHPFGEDDSWKSMNCSDCHTGGS